MQERHNLRNSNDAGLVKKCTNVMNGYARIENIFLESVFLSTLSEINTKKTVVQTFIQERPALAIS